MIDEKQKYPTDKKRFDENYDRIFRQQETQDGQADDQGQRTEETIREWGSARSGGVQASAVLDLPPCSDA